MEETQLKSENFIESNKDIDELNFSFDDLYIIASFENDVIVVGDYFDEEKDDSVKCLLVIDRPLFHIAMDHWINNKASLCELWGHFCGVGGRISCTKFDKIDVDFEILDESQSFDEDEELKYLKVETFRVHYIEPHCDMEHG